MRNNHTTLSSARQEGSFETLKTEFERLYSIDPQDDTTGVAALNLAAAAAASVVRKLIDPARTSAPARGCVSDSGCSSAMNGLRRDIRADTFALRNLRGASAAARRIRMSEDGYAESIVVDDDAERAVDALISECLKDGIDLVQEAAAALYAQAAEHAAGAGWLDVPYTSRKLSRRVYISTTAAPVYRDEETTPMREVYRAVRRAVADSRAVQTDPRSGYTYVEDMTEDGLDAILYRAGRYADIGGADGTGLYSSDLETISSTETLIARMNLTDRQARVLALRVQGHSVSAIAEHLQTSRGAVQRVMQQLRVAAAEIGLASMDVSAAVDIAKPVEQMDAAGAVVAVYPSVSSASSMTGVNAGTIRAAAAGKRCTAGGYRWRFVK